MYLSKFYFTLLSNATLVTLSTLAQAQVVNLDDVLVKKLNAQGPKITQLANPGAGYTFQSASYGGNFGATNVVFKNLEVTTEPLSASSTFLGACFPATYTITAGVTASTDVGYTFTSATSLSTDTTIKADASYGPANISVTSNIKTSDAKTSTKTSQNITANSTTATMKSKLNCSQYNQPQFFQGIGSVDKNTWIDSVNKGTDINYYYYAFPSNTNIYDGKAQFKAKFYKPGSTTQGPTLIITFYDKNNTVLAQYPVDTLGCQANPNACGYQIFAGNQGQPFFGTNVYKSAKYYNISFGGNPASIGVRFSNKKGAWSNSYQSVNNRQDLPNNFSGSDLNSVEITNRGFTSVAADTKEVSLLINKVLSNSDPISASDDLKYQVDGIYNSTSLNSVAMQVVYNMKSWDQLNKMGGYTTLLNSCGGATLEEAKKSWANSCGSNSIKSESSKVLPLNLIMKK
jgi:hypothetical protein